MWDLSIRSSLDTFNLLTTVISFPLGIHIASFEKFMKLISEFCFKIFLERS